MNGIVNWWGRNPVAGNLLMLACLVMGFLSFTRMEKEFFPPGADNAIMINAAWPGASPQDIESQVTVRIEEAVAAINGVDWTRSQSGEGYAWVRLSLMPGVDPTDIETEVRSQVEAISGLPPAVERIQVQRFTGRDFLFLLSVHGEASERTLREVVKRMRDEIALLPGGVNAQVWSTRNPEVSIELSEEAMRRYGLTFDEVAQAVRAHSLNAGGGAVRTEEGSFQLQVRNLADTQSDFERIIIRQTQDGGALTVGDVATVIDGFQDVDSYSVLNGEASAMVAVLTPDQANIEATGKAMDEYLADLIPTLPPGLELTVVIDSRDQYSSLLGILFSNAAMGFFLIFVLLLLTLHPKVALWSTIGVVTAFAGSFIILPYVNVSMNFMTVFGFLLVLGIMVDDAIIVGEAIYERVERGEHGVDSSILATQLVMKPLMASVLTTMIAFSPLMFLDGAVQQFTQAISIVIMSTLFFSLVETLIILPAHLAHVRLIEPSETFWGRLMKAQQACANAVVWFAENVHGPCVRTAIRFRWLTVSIFIVIIALSVAVFASGRVKQSFMPEVEGDFIYASVEMPRTTSFVRMQEVAQQLDRARLALQAETQDVSYTDPDDAVTTSGIVLSWAQFINDTSVENYVTLTPPETREIRTSYVAERLKELIGEIPDAERISVQLNPGGGGDGERIEFAMIGEDSAELRAGVDELKARLAQFEAVTSVRDSQEAANEELRFSLLPGAEQLGISLADVQRQVRQAYFGEEVQRLPRDGDEVRVYVRYPRDDRRTLESIENFRIRTPDGREVPLATVATASFAPGVVELNRRQRMPTITVEAEAPAEDRAEIMRELEENFFPQLEAKYPGLSRRAIGEAEGQAEFFQNLTNLGVAALFGIFFVLAVTFRSYVQPALIMSVIPFAFVGAMVAHWATGTSFALFSWLGMVAAIGVVVNDNVVLMDRVNRLREEGASAYDAVTGGSVSRFRQIFLTSITEFVGLLPMLAETEVVAQFLKPMALSLALGVLLTMPASLYLTPALYTCGVDVKRAAGGWWRTTRGLFGGRRARPAE
ncbi:MAG: efflux RND transporter permease subunit [Alphaproteobacteria bacterium]|nr:efflux RND transporter permease subunit [Alphaproteobacteria bacterium]